MARLLVKAVDAHNPNPDKDRYGCYKTYDPILAMPDGHVWGRCENTGLTRSLDLPGVDPADLAPYLHSEWRGGNRTIRRACRVRPEALTSLPKDLSLDWVFEQKPADTIYRPEPQARVWVTGLWLVIRWSTLVYAVRHSLSSPSPPCPWRP